MLENYLRDPEESCYDGVVDDDDDQDWPEDSPVWNLHPGC